MDNGKGIIHELAKNRTLFLMILPATIFFILFCYVPMFGSILAFKDYNVKDGIFLSPWSGLDNFRFLLVSGRLWLVTKNTVLYNLAFETTAPVLQCVVAIFLAEMSSKFIRKITQGMMFLPYFISWVIVGTFIYNLFNYDYGLLNSILKSFGLSPTDVYGNPDAWKYILLVFHNWKLVGYGSVLYLAAIMSIDQEIMEAAEIDRANIFTRIRCITIPYIIPTFTILFLLAIGRIFRGNFDMFYQIIGDNGTLFDKTDVIDTFTFRALLRSNDIGMSSASAFYQSVLCFITIIGANAFVRKISKDNALF